MVIGLTPWWPMITRSRAWSSVLAVHRVTGDVQYFPLVSALARMNLGDPSVYESHGAGLASFPFASLVGHAACVALFGTYGWLLADASVAVAYLVLGRWLLVRTGTPRRWATLASLTILFACLEDWFSRIHTAGLPLGMFPSPSVAIPVSPLRFPRPYVTEVFVLCALVTLVQVCVPGPGRSGARKTHALLAGAAVAGLAQADIYAAAGILPWFTSLVVVRFVWELRQSGCRDDVRTMALLLFGTMLVVMTPFVLQRFFEQPDVARRLGMYRVSRSSFTLPVTTLGQLALGAFAAAAVAIPLILRKPTGAQRRTLLSLVALFVVAAGSALAKPMFVVVTGRMLQSYHFEKQFHRTFGVAATCLAVWLGHLLLARGATMIRARLGLTPHTRARLRTAISLVWTLGIGIVVMKRAVTEIRTPPIGAHVRADFFHYEELGDGYLEDLRALTEQLARRRAIGLDVLATMDHELMVWWVAFAHGFVLNPDPFTTTIPDSEIERRMVAFTRAVQIEPEKVAGFLTQDNDERRNNSLGHDNIVNTFFFGHQKYGGPAGWYLEIPPADLQRMTALSQRWNDSDEIYRIDGLVLFARGSLAYLQPDPARFVLAYENPTFRLYVRPELD